jgi:N6-adenosine-specific RNA methylase IME4
MARERRGLVATSDPLPSAPPVILAADCPWQHADSLGKKGAQAKYACMPTDKIARFPLPDAVVDAQCSVLFLWALSNMLPDALFVLQAWGYRPHSMMIWEKFTNPAPPKQPVPAFGPGRIVRNCHEPILIGVRGRGYVPDFKSQRSSFGACTREHSRKPDQFFEIIERMYPRSEYYELFAVDVRDRWHQQGLSLGKRVEQKRGSHGQGSQQGKR